LSRVGCRRPTARAKSPRQRAAPSRKRRHMPGAGPGQVLGQGRRAPPRCPVPTHVKGRVSVRARVLALGHMCRAGVGGHSAFRWAWRPPPTRAASDVARRRPDTIRANHRHMRSVREPCRRAGSTTTTRDVATPARARLFTVSSQHSSRHACREHSRAWWCVKN